VKPPYRSELEALDATYAAACGADVEELREAISELASAPALFVGSGGSMVVAVLAAKLHERVARQSARACTAFELLDTPQLERRGALLFSSSAKHPDAIRGLDEFRRGRFSPTVLLTHRASEELEPSVGPDTRIVTLDRPVQPDGFLATGSVMQTATLLFRAYLDQPALPLGVAPDASDAAVREDVLVLMPPRLACVAADIEVRLVESGLSCVQIADYRNFAHGRHTGFARRADRTTVLLLSDPSSVDLADATADLLPAATDVRRWHGEGSWERAVVTLLARSMWLAAVVGEQSRLDVARPKVPAFGRRLYRLPFKRRFAGEHAGGVERKVLASGGGDHSALRRHYSRAGAQWISELADQRFVGLVLDYDGTVCWTRRRWDLPEAEIRQALADLLDRGLMLGFASGRGRSLHRDLRRWIPESCWSRITVGLYNGAILLGLNEELGDVGKPTPWSNEVVAAIDAHDAGLPYVMEERGEQVSVAIADGAVHHGHLAAVLGAALEDAKVAAQIVASGHSVDIIKPESCKTAVVDAVAERAEGVVLAIGDQGQVGGNDHALLRSSRWTLSVDRCSPDPWSGWYLGPGDHVGPDLLLRYLRGLRKTRAGFAIKGFAIS